MKLFNKTKKPFVKNFLHSTLDITSFIVLTILYSFALLLKKISNKWSRFNKVFIKFDNWVKSLDKADKSGVSRLYLIEISFKNMAAK